MHMMFVDESGDPGYPSDGNWNNFGGSRLFVRVGVIIHGWKWKTWNERLITFKKNRGLLWDAELKASDIRRGKGDFSGWDQNRRQWFLNEILQLIEGNPNITLIGVAIDKTLVTGGTERIRRPEIRSMELLLERYNAFLNKQHDKSGIVVLDPTQVASDDNIRYFQSYLQAHSGHMRPLHIVESTFFAKSHTSNMIQIADICTNVLYRREAVAKGGDDEYKLISPRFWRHNKKLQGYGIKRWPDRKSPRK